MSVVGFSPLGLRVRAAPAKVAAIPHGARSRMGAGGRARVVPGARGITHGANGRVEKWRPAQQVGPERGLRLATIFEAETAQGRV